MFRGMSCDGATDADLGSFYPPGPGRLHHLHRMAARRRTCACSEGYSGWKPFKDGVLIDGREIAHVRIVVRGQRM